MLTDEQKEARREWIGASDAPAILGLSPYATAFDIWNSKVHGVYSDDTEATRQGSILEPYILDMLEEYLGMPVTQRGVAIDTEGRFGFPLRVSLDGAIILDDGTMIPVNAKTSGDGAGYGEDLSDEVPDHVAVQEYVEMLATGAPYAVVPVLMGGLRGFQMNVYRIPRPDNETLRAMVEQLKAFWFDHVVPKIPPPIGERAPNMELLKKIRRQPNSTIVLDEATAALWDEHEAAGDIRLKAEKDEKRLKALIVAALKDCEGGLLPDGRLLTYCETKRDIKAKEAYTQTFRQLKITKVK